MDFYDDAGKRIKREIDAYINTTAGQMGRRQILIPPPGTLNTITPCAACKLLRRRCAEECPFSPYFSPHEPHKFAAVHKIFGASNVSKLLMEVPESQRADAANSLVYEANVRLRDPIYGCMGAISALQQQIQSLQSDLNAVRAEILRYKYREAAANTHDINIIASTLVSSGPIAASQLSSIPAPATPPPPQPSIEVPESQRADAANSLVYEANVRLRDPIYGCMGAISALQQQIQSLQSDLNAVRAEILRYKYREAAANTHDINIIASTLVSSGPIAASQLSSIPAPATPPPPQPTSTIPNNNVSSYFA
ncbi:LOB domain-containing protein 15 [Artemisia annua]|uniref:LOB domain-containing protein 15 n=1 Tax=Artemisia annua TaxID=35608 RepID=A0A2U1Q3D2_ARTAN|nr:LOB domain-containing protein 15 [Artemisia annua]